MGSQPAWGDSSSDDGCNCMRHHPGHMWGGPTGSPWPWWAGMPLSQISAATGGTWPWAFGPPLFLPPPVPPLPPIGLGIGANNLTRISAQAIIPGRLSNQALAVPGAGLGLGAGFGLFGLGGAFNVNGGVNGFGFFR